jgi:hypothetical protein
MQKVVELAIPPLPPSAFVVCSGTALSFFFDRM